MKNTTTNFTALETFDTLTQEQLLEVSGGFDLFNTACKKWGICFSLDQTKGAATTLLG